MSIQKIIDEERSKSKLSEINPTYLTRVLTCLERELDDEFREKREKILKERANDPEYRKNHKEALARPETRQRMCEASQKRLLNTEAEEKRKDKIRATMATEEYQKKHKEGIEKTKNNLDWRKNSYNAKQDPVYKEKQRQRYLGEKGPSFKGVCVGTHKKTGEVIRLVGSTALEAAGFTPNAVYNCINKVPGCKSSGGYTWTREEPTK